MTEKLTLKKSITVAGETISELTFRDPTGADIIACGQPMAMRPGEGRGDKPLMVQDTAVIAKCIVRLAGIPIGSVEQFSAQDFVAASGIVLSFFGEPEETKGATS